VNSSDLRGVAGNDNMDKIHAALKDRMNEAYSDATEQLEEKTDEYFRPGRMVESCDES
jgi:hypothetical protein